MIADSTSSNKRIAKNTLMLYIRMFFAMLVGLYTSRVVLKVLGIDDYGIFNVVGGVVTMFGFLNATLSGATSRFITYALGKGDFNVLKRTFNTALVVHIGIAVIILIIAETFGLWFINHKLVLPENRMLAAHCIYQFSIASAMLSITQVPFNACIIAHERMTVYAYVEMLHVVLKLLIVYLLTLSSYDKLIAYSFLLFSVTLLITTIYKIYSTRHFSECKIQFIYDKQIGKQILSFSGYNLLGNFGYLFNMQGITILINNFFGLALNAASGVATTVSNVVTSFANNVITAFRPPITKSYAANNIKDVEKYLCLGLSLSIYLYALFAIPVIIEIETLLRLWLVKVPESSSLFCRLILIGLLFDLIRHMATIAIHAVGKVKYVSLANGIFFSLNPIIIYLIYSHMHYAPIAYICNIVTCTLLCCIVVSLVKKYIPEVSLRHIIRSIIAPIGVMVATISLSISFSLQMENSFLRVIITTIISGIILTLLTYFVVLNDSERGFAIKLIRNRLIHR